MSNRQDFELQRLLLESKKLMGSVREQLKVTESIIREIEGHLAVSKKKSRARVVFGQRYKQVREESLPYQSILKKRRASEDQEGLRKLSALRTGFRLSQRELAGIVGVSERTIFNWLSAKASLTRLAREKIDKLFRVYEVVSREINEEARRRWLFAQNELLGDSAHSLLVKGEFDKVLADLEAMREGVHV
jgi:transcriptional regulator with XRE-family HTH domain